MPEIVELHDWLLESIELGQEQAKFAFRHFECEERRTLSAKGVKYLVCNNVREGNIVLSVDIGAEFISEDALRRLLDDNPHADLSEHREKLCIALQSGDLQFMQVVPSYGAEILLIATCILSEK